MNMYWNIGPPNLLIIIPDHCFVRPQVFFCQVTVEEPRVLHPDINCRCKPYTFFFDRQTFVQISIICRKKHFSYVSYDFRRFFYPRFTYKLNLIMIEENDVRHGVGLSVRSCVRNIHTPSPPHPHRSMVIVAQESEDCFGVVCTLDWARKALSDWNHLANCFSI